MLEGDIRAVSDVATGEPHDPMGTFIATLMLKARMQ